MIKKVLSVMLLTVGIIISSQIAASAYAKWADVDDYYAYTNERGVNYYIYYIEYMDEMYGGSTYVDLKGIRNNQNMGTIRYMFQKNGNYIFEGSSGKIESNAYAKKVYDIINSEDIKKHMKVYR